VAVDYDSAYDKMIHSEVKLFHTWIGENDFYDDKFQLKIDGDLMDLWIEFESQFYYIFLEYMDVAENIDLDSFRDSIIELCSILKIQRFEDFQFILSGSEINNFIIFRLKLK